MRGFSDGVALFSASVDRSAVSGSALHAQAPRPIPVRHLTTVAATDSGVLANVFTMHAMSDGRVVMIDAVKKQLLLLDASMKHVTVLADTAGTTVHYGDETGGLLPFIGDSSAFVDQTARALVVIDAAGHFGRVTTPPKVTDMRFFYGSANGNPGFDARGRLYYRPLFNSNTGLISSRDTTYLWPDSAPVIRADFDARRLDTIAMLHIPLVKQRLAWVNGRPGMSRIGNPVPVTDEWAYFSDGTVVIVRGQDYHLDWIAPDGTKRSTPKMPFDWRRITPEESSACSTQCSASSIRRTKARPHARSKMRGRAAHR